MLTPSLTLTRITQPSWQLLHPRRHKNAIPLLARQFQIVGLDLLPNPIDFGAAQDGHDLRRVLEQPRQRDQIARHAMLAGDLVHDAYQPEQSVAPRVVRFWRSTLTEQAAADRAPRLWCNVLLDALVEGPVVHDIQPPGMHADLVEIGRAHV